MIKLFNCLAIVFAMVLFASCNGKKTANEAEENKIVIEKEDYKVTILDDNSDVVRDTIDLDTYLSKIEELVLELKEFHVEALADTAVFQDKFESKLNIIGDSLYVDFNPDHILHSQKVRALQAIIMVFDELYRVEQEFVSVGYQTKHTDEDMMEFRKEFQEELEKELN